MKNTTSPIIFFFSKKIQLLPIFFSMKIQHLPLFSFSVKKYNFSRYFFNENTISPVIFFFSKKIQLLPDIFSNENTTFPDIFFYSKTNYNLSLIFSFLRKKIQPFSNEVTNICHQCLLKTLPT